MNNDDHAWNGNGWHRKRQTRGGTKTERHPRCRALIAVCVMLGLPLPARELSDHATRLFSGAANCAFCHDQWGRGLTDKHGNAVSIAADWRATMMGNSFVDPFWRAVMEAEVAENPTRQGFIENKCQTCHAPAARTQAHADGTNALTFAAARVSPLAGEGVGCTVCHQILPGNLGKPPSFTGQFEIGCERRIFGPYQKVLTMPMIRHVDYTPEYGAHTQDSALCATCHTLFTPILAADGTVAGEFPEQVPYLEWRQSDYARRGQHCQDCHMPRLDNPIKISSRPPWLKPRQPFWRHQFAGGNAFLLTMLAQHADEVGANAETESFQAMTAHTRGQLQQAARLRVKGRRQDDSLVLRVEVENLTGHKFPTGHPYRRAWLHVRVSARTGATVFESGAVDAAGRLLGLEASYAPHQDVITQPGEVQVYQAVMADQAGEPTWSLLRAATLLKDNRLPPAGFQPRGEDAQHVAITGVTNDANFHTRANGRDEVTYRIPFPNSHGRLIADVELLYQSVPPESVARLLNSPGPAAQTFTRLYRAMDQRPELVQRIRAEF